MILYIYNEDYSEQSIRQMETLISFIEADLVYIDSKWSEYINNEKNNLIFEDLTNYLNLKANKAIMYLNIIDGLKLMKLKKNSTKFIFRPRGILPEESFYKNGKLFNRTVLNIVEKIVVSKTDFFIFLNKSQYDHYKYKYAAKLNMNKNYTLLPNVKEIRKSNISDEIYRDTIVYSGGFSKWQNVDMVFSLFKFIIHDLSINCSFIILTFEENFERANKLSKDYEIEMNVDIKYVEPNKLNEELSKYRFGIIVRDNDSVNRTASPFKIIDYTSNGLSIITTSNIASQAKEILRNQFIFEVDYSTNGLSFNKDDFKQFITDNMDENINNQIIRLYNEYIDNIKKVNFNELLNY